MTRLALAVLLAAVALVPRTAGQAEPLPFDVVVRANERITARDGTRLAADVYLPARGGEAAAGKHPTLLTRTPYDKTRAAGEAKWFAARGYAVVVNDTRGRFASEGTWRALVDDPSDGADVVKWITEQPWSSGKVGTFGTSYVGGTQHALACANPPGLACMIPVDAMSNAGIAGVRHAGAFELRFFNWAFLHGAANSRTALANPALKAALDREAKLVPQHMLRLPLRPGTSPLKHVPEAEAWIVEAMRHGDYDDYWKRPGLSVVDNLAAYADVPAYHVTGWYDSWCRQNVMNWQALSRAKTSPQRLIVGPWTHGQQHQPFAGEIEFPADAALDFNAWRLRWFDRWVKGVENGVEKEGPVRLFVMGGGDGRKSKAGRLRHGGRWREEAGFPLARTAFTPYYLHPGGKLAPVSPAPGSVTYRYDPADPVPTIGGNISSFAGIVEPGGFDQRCRKDTLYARDELPLSQRRDVLVFQTDPLPEDVEVTGPVAVHLTVSSTAPDTDFTAKLVDVYPPNPDYPLGFDLNVGDSIARMRYRDTPERAVSPLKPGTLYTVTIHLYPTANVFAKGHRIRLDVSSSNFPRFDVNPNTGDPLQEHRRLVPADNTVRLGASHVVLPVISRAGR